MILLPSNQRRLARDLRDMREFGYVFQFKRDALGRIRVRPVARTMNTTSAVPSKEG
jgi:hypothetical protein